MLLVLFNAGATNLQALIGGDVQIMGSAFVETVGGRAAGVESQIFGESVISCLFSFTHSLVSSR